MQLDHIELSLYSRQISLQEVGVAGQMKLKNASVLCIGAGGLGAPLLQYLAAAGVGKLGIIDNDHVELSNLQRQIIYSHDDIGKPKVEAAKTYLTKLNPYTNVEIFHDKFTERNARQLISAYDIIADCTDNIENRYLVNHVCLIENKPFVFAGISKHQGQCMMFHGENGPCFQCLFPRDERLLSLPDCRAGGVLGVLPGIVGGVQAGMIMREILQLGESRGNQFHTFDMTTMQWQAYHVDKHDDCPACGKQKYQMPTVMSISAEDLQNMQASDDEFILLDVRSRAEHDEQNIGGKLIPLTELPQRWRELDSAVPVVVYCHAGIRSMAAARFLLEHQFHSVMNLSGGIVSCEACGMI